MRCPSMNARVPGLDLGLFGTRVKALREALLTRPGSLRSNGGPQICRRSLSQDATVEVISLGRRGSNRQDEPEHEKIRIDVESKRVKTASGSLPLSPLMDPAFHEARSRFSKPKAPESSVKQKSKFQRKLERNPYAQALATPSRQCAATGVILPRYFLQDFNLVSHPETGQPWFISPSLASDQSPGTPLAQTSEPQVDSPVSTQAHEPRAGSRKVNKKPAGPTGYMLSRQQLLKEFQEGPRFTYSKAHTKRLLRQNNPQRIGWALRKAVWREDMDSFLLELMRRRIVERLLYFSDLCEREGRKYLVRCESWDDIRNNVHRGCVLWLSEGGVESRNDGPNGPNQLPGTAPGQLATLDIHGCQYGDKLAVHNLRSLLGDAHLAHLKQRSTLLRGNGLFLLGRRRTIDLQLKLWKLQGYIATF